MAAKKKVGKAKAKLAVVQSNADKEKHLNELKNTHNIFTFVFNKVLCHQFYPEEFQLAHLSLEMFKKALTDTAAKIELLEPKTEGESGKPDIKEQAKDGKAE